MKSNLKYDLKELLKYMAYGTLATAVNFLTYCLLELTGLELNVCNFISWLASVLFAFFTNHKFVFQPTGKKLIREFSLFFGARCVTGILEIGLFPVLLKMDNHTLFGVEGFAAKVIVCIIVITVNYFLSKFIIFKRRK